MATPSEKSPAIEIFPSHVLVAGEFHFSDTVFVDLEN